MSTAEAPPLEQAQASVRTVNPDLSQRDVDRNDERIRLLYLRKRKGEHPDEFWRYRDDADV